MALLGLTDVTIAFGGPALLDGASLGIERGERVCLLGRNGTGKSTLMKLLDGTITPDSGEVIRQTGAAVTRLEQDIPAGLVGSTFDLVAAGLGEAGTLLARYHAASLRVEHGGDAALRELDRLHHALDAADGWQLHTRVDTVLSHLGLEPETDVATLSGGRKRQALLARALVRQPDVLLLDEPTNHLDVEAIEWMEEFLIGRGITLLFVTHDRAFLRRLATRIVELDRGKLVDWGADYDGYLERKEAALGAEEREWALFDKKLAKEEVWIRTGIQARRTRNEGRVRALEALRLERSARRDRLGTVRLQAQEAERSGKLVVEARDIGFAHGDHVIVRHFTTTVTRGDRIGFIGPNGSGKTTLLRLLLGELPPRAGPCGRGPIWRSRTSTRCGSSSIPIGPSSTVSPTAWIRWRCSAAASTSTATCRISSFLHRGPTPRSVRCPAASAIACCWHGSLPGPSMSSRSTSRPTTSTSRRWICWKGLLLEFTGTLLIVSHDRAFLDNVVTSTLVMEGAGRVGEYAGGYSDWVRVRPAAGPAASPVVPAVSAPASAPTSTEARPRKLSFKEVRELGELPDRIEALEAERDTLFATLADPAVLRDGSAAAERKARLTAVEADLANAFARWEALEARNSGT